MLRYIFTAPTVHRVFKMWLWQRVCMQCLDESTCCARSSRLCLVCLVLKSLASAEMRGTARKRTKWFNVVGIWFCTYSSHFEVQFSSFRRNGCAHVAVSVPFRHDERACGCCKQCLAQVLTLTFRRSRLRVGVFSGVRQFYALLKVDDQCDLTLRCGAIFVQLADKLARITWQCRLLV